MSLPLPLIPWIISKFTSKSTDPLPQPHDPHLWTGGKFLGKGGNGMTTLWTYIGPSPKPSFLPLPFLRSERTIPEPFPHLINKTIVLKTALHPLALASLRAEYYTMVQLLQRNESHITKIITGIASADVDRNKIYLEYCKNGDLEAEIKRRREKQLVSQLSRPESPPQLQLVRKRKWEEMDIEGEVEEGVHFSEEELWRMLVCMAKAAVAMARERQFLHMDMHAGNVLIGDIGGEDHSCNSLEPQYKIADFGVVMEWDGQLNIPYDSRDGIDAFQNLAAEDFHMNDFHPSAPTPTFGERCNVWGIGLTMYQAILISPTQINRAEPSPQQPYKHYSPASQSLSDRHKSEFGAGVLPPGWKYGRQLETANMYSEELRVTIQHCLMENYVDRISSQELLKKAEYFVGVCGGGYGGRGAEPEL